MHDLKQAEAQFFDRVARIRGADGHIPLEADMRRATRVDPAGPGDLRIDPKMGDILDRGARQRYLDAVTHRAGGHVLELCCGPGWLALEMGRRGQNVDAYDISPEAIALARRTLAENPFREGFGSVTYHLEDVTGVDFPEHTFDAVSGWSAFHHIPDLDLFMERIWRALKPGGIIATMDDMPRGMIERGLEYGVKFFLPIYTLTYRQKTALAFRRLIGLSPFPAEVFSPMEEAKHTSVFDIERIFHARYTVLTQFRQNAFAGTPAMMLSGPDAFRYSTARALVGVDALLCRLGIVQGFERIIIAQKPMQS